MATRICVKVQPWQAPLASGVGIGEGFKLCLSALAFVCFYFCEHYVSVSLPHLSGQAPGLTNPR